MNRCTLFAVAVVLASVSPWAVAKQGVIVQGENGTKWCCPKGEKGPDCNKGASTIPVGARCNFADLLVPIDPTAPAGPSTPITRDHGMAAQPLTAQPKAAQVKAAQAVGAAAKGE